MPMESPIRNAVSTISSLFSSSNRRAPEKSDDGEVCRASTPTQCNIGFSSFQVPDKICQQHDDATRINSNNHNGHDQSIISLKYEICTHNSCQVLTGLVPQPAKPAEDEQVSYRRRASLDRGLQVCGREQYSWASTDNNTGPQEMLYQSLWVRCQRE